MLYDVMFTCGYNTQECANTEVELRTAMKTQFPRYSIFEIRPVEGIIMNLFKVNFTLVSDTHPNGWLQGVITESLNEGELIADYNCSPGDEEGSYEIFMELQLTQNPRHWIQETIELNLSPSIESVTNMDIN